MKKQTTSLLFAAMIALTAKGAEDPNFNYVVDNFADIEVLRYEVPGFKDLPLQQKKMVYYLSQAAQAGRDIIWDQNGKYNLEIRRMLENVFKNYKGDRNSKEFKAFEKYLKQVWFGNGIHHHYSNDKFVPEFSETFLRTEAGNLGTAGDGTDLIEIIFNPQLFAKKVNLDSSLDVVANSAGNLYEGVTQAEVEAYYSALKNPEDPSPISYGLNSKIVKENGEVTEQHYKFL